MKYILDFDCAENELQERVYALSGTDKARYISSSISRSKGLHIEIISPAPTKKQRGLVPARKYDVNGNLSVKLFSTWGCRSRASRALRRVWADLSLMSYLLLNLKTNETVLVYHELKLMPIIALIKRIKKLNLILEIEEIYGDVSENKRIIEKEMKFFRLADQYIFPTELLDEKINISHKPSIIIHGTYQVEPEKITREDYYRLHGWDPAQYHIVYAGTLDPRKGGAAAAAVAAEFLSAQYHVHILGFGSDSDIQKMKRLVSDISQKTPCRLSFDGLLSGDDYIRFIQSCHIGLSSQNPDAAFNDTSFPSKILSYMANGLRVVSIRIPVIEKSAIGEDMFYYEKQTPEEIAKAIQSVDFSKPYDSRAKIRLLDEQFKAEIADLLQ